MFFTILRLKLFFLRHSSCGLKLPSGWFGRPHDNYLSLVRAYGRDGALIVDLDFPLHLTFYGAPAIEWAKDGLYFTGFSTLTVEWCEAGTNTRRPHHEEFTAGEVHFVPLGTV